MKMKNIVNFFHIAIMIFSCFDWTGHYEHTYCLMIMACANAYKDDTTENINKNIFNVNQNLINRCCRHTENKGYAKL